MMNRHVICSFNQKNLCLEMVNINTVSLISAHILYRQLYYFKGYFLLFVIEKSQLLLQPVAVIRYTLLH